MQLATRVREKYRELTEKRKGGMRKCKSVQRTAKMDEWNGKQLLGKTAERRKMYVLIYWML